MFTQRLTISEVKDVAHRLAQQTLGWSEPIPDFATRFDNVLESCLDQPFQTFARKSLYPGFIKKAATLFYLMIKNHPFKNGNKRIAMTTLFYFLYKNKKWLRVDNHELYNFAKWVAESNPKLKNATVDAIEIFLKEYLTEI